MNAPMVAGYYSNSRPELHELVPPDAATLLDVGCGEGAFGAALRAARPGLTVWGIEKDPQAASVAATRYERVLVGTYPEATASVDMAFDCITFNDVLEHMVDPWEALTLSKALLAEGGIVIVSVPNIASFGVIRDLLRDEFNYVHSGVLDRTHLRFFTRKTAIAMARGAGFDVRSVRHSWPHRSGWQKVVIDLLRLGRFNGRQVVLVLEAA